MYVVSTKLHDIVEHGILKFKTITTAFRQLKHRDFNARRVKERRSLEAPLLAFRVQTLFSADNGDKRFDIFEEINLNIMIIMCEKSDLLPQFKSMRQ